MKKNIVRSSYWPESNIPVPPWQSETASGPVITNVRSIVTAPEGVNLVVVVVETSEPGLIGYGCATFTQRAFAVKTAIDLHVKPLAMGRHVADITDIFNMVFVESYWRGDVVLNNALSGLDMALWDIKGKMAAMPVWQLLGGRARQGIPCYVHASGANSDELLGQVQQQIENGYQYIRCQVGVPGTNSYGAKVGTEVLPSDPHAYLRHVPNVLNTVRETIGDGFHMIHDLHERFTPSQAVQFFDAVEQAKLLYIEDPLAPEDLEWMPRLRERSSIPIAIGELFTRYADYLPLISNRQIDIVRSHISAIGGITPAWKLIQVTELFGLQFALHGPRDVSPIGHAANLALEFASPALAVREHTEFSDAVHEVFGGLPLAKNGYIKPSKEAGLGITFDEKLAESYPAVPATSNWHYMRSRRVDGTVQRP